MPDRYYRCISCRRVFRFHLGRFEVTAALPEEVTEPHPLRCAECEAREGGASFEETRMRSAGGVVTGKVRKVF